MLHKFVVLMLLLVRLSFVLGSPLYPQLLIPNEEIKKSTYIRHYTGAFYDTAALKRHRDRSRRDFSGIGKEVGSTLNLHVNAFDRIFKMRLKRDKTLFHDAVLFETSNGTISFDPSHVYVGGLEDDEKATVHGIITTEGLFDGTVITGTDEIYIEPFARYSHLVRRDINELNPADNHHHSIAYRSSDVSTPLDILNRPINSERISENDLFNFTHALNDPILFDADEFLNTDYSKNADNEESFDVYRDDREKYLRSRKRTVDPKKTTCMLYLQADHTFVEHYKSEEACIEVMTRHVQRVNAIYRYTDFNQDGEPDNISFMIKRVKIHGASALKDPAYRFNGKYGVEEYLELFSEENYDAFCLSYMFTYRDFEKGTLGLAWTGDLKNAGGVCEKNGHYRGSMKSLNTGIITLLNYGKHVPPAVSHVTLAHEIGHNFGSPHDPDECSPGGEDGNFIMFARATSGDKRNNNRFSRCSLISINPVLDVKARSTKGCFAEHQIAICGNGVVEEGEECDCGWEEDCNDPCCHPQRLHHAPFEIPCRLTEDAVCSPSQGPCCTTGCSLRSGTKCRDDNGCRDASFCDGRGPQCPPSVNKPNKTICNDEFVCFMGECTGSICLAYGLESCQCKARANDPLTKSCELCCKLPGENQPCISSFEWNSLPYEIPDMMSKPGTPCNDYNGYCDIFQRCREVDPTGPLATLRRLLLSDASLERFHRWMTDRWYTVAFSVIIIMTGLVIMTRLLSKQSDTNMKIIYLNESNINNSKSLDDSRRNNNYFNEVKIFKCFTIFKKRLLEKMKTLVSPRKKDISSLESLQSISSEFVTYNKFKNNYYRSNSGDDDNNFYLISLISKFYNKNKKIRRQRKLMNNLVAVDNGKVTNTQLLSDNNYYLINYRDNLDVRNATSDLENLLRQS
ncbi:disintegrin and metalloproteinase domain-containing protein 10-like [Cotesia glomerata]|uniref:disintegrin and metalloproteinase domain-containing protein 10-like n=1 Tax=Cotesia glomerata TaxID=32391 RepID=UPI001D00BA87|nr:disintegrin and metalloproteinase domain-containing protein 10-like [Cotesia glomerata]XP_044581255.1 disintegrin and metalloproteinase domain-containing protein 10-like [Cotesia glomerata]XP_044581256.1 disintegrin and metalloproteinase domain-containing protein 10-like [Cotesia glomerata]XP_044581257.1 disintegrin and metalloproteinase domain-containing protein 10-like [Cotesia glomerata]